MNNKPSQTMEERVAQVDLVIPLEWIKRNEKEKTKTTNRGIVVINLCDENNTIQL